MLSKFTCLEIGSNIFDVLYAEKGGSIRLLVIAGQSDYLDDNIKR